MASLAQDPNTSTTDEKRFPSQMAACPTCGQKTVMTYLGEQRWPEDIAKALDMEPVVTLWQCGHCHTTVTRTE